MDLFYFYCKVRNDLAEDYLDASKRVSLREIVWRQGIHT